MKWTFSGTTQDADVTGQFDRDGREVVVWVMLGALGVVDERGKDDDAEDEEEDEQREFVSAGLERLNENLETRGVTRQLKQSHDSNHTVDTHTYTHTHTHLFKRKGRQICSAPLREARLSAQVWITQFLHCVSE